MLSSLCILTVTVHIPNASAALIDNANRATPAAGKPSTVETKALCNSGNSKACAQQTQTDDTNIFSKIFQFIISLLAIIVVSILMLHIIRLMYEVFHAKNLVYIRVMLPRADSKLDKERETRKDFKEKISSMTVFYNSIHKLGNIQFWDTMRNWILNRTKISLELVYDHGEVYFFVVTYAEDVKVVSQQITALYPDAEVAIIKNEDYPETKPQ